MYHIIDNQLRYGRVEGEKVDNCKSYARLGEMTFAKSGFKKFY